MDGIEERLVEGHVTDQSRAFVQRFNSHEWSNAATADLASAAAPGPSAPPASRSAPPACGSPAIDRQHFDHISGAIVSPFQFSGNGWYSVNG